MTLESTALVHETYLRLIDVRVTSWSDRAHFFALSGTADAPHPRGRRQGPEREETWGPRGTSPARRDYGRDQIAAADSSAASLIELNEAPETLARIDPRRAQVVELRFFGGLTVDETADVLQVSTPTVMRDWRLAKAWLARELRGG